MVAGCVRDADDEKNFMSQVAVMQVAVCEASAIFKNALKKLPRPTLFFV